jgi:hypothetical protein
MIASVAAAALAGMGVAFQVYRVRPRVAIRWGKLLVKDVHMRTDHSVGIRLEMTNVGDASIQKIEATPLLDGSPAWDVLARPIEFDETPFAAGHFPGLTPGATVEIAFAVKLEHASVARTHDSVDFHGHLFGAKVRLGRWKKMTLTKP